MIKSVLLFSWTITAKMISLSRKLSVLFSTHAGELNHLYNVGSADGTAYLKLATLRDYDTPTFRVTGGRSSSELQGPKTLGGVALSPFPQPPIVQRSDEEYLYKMVGNVGFEPTISWSQTRRINQTFLIPVEYVVPSEDSNSRYLKVRYLSKIV